MTKLSSSSRPRTSVPVVAIGASAGALSVLQDFFQAVSPRSGRAYVVIQHLAPDHDSMLAEILGRATEMPVRQASDGTRLQPDEVVVIKPNTTMTYHAGRLRLRENQADRRLRMPVDGFFRSLAGALADACMAIIFSGTGTDGSEGVKAVKCAGGLVLVQDPAEAEHEGMPRSAIATGAVDFAAYVADMPALLDQYDEHRLQARKEATEVDHPQVHEVLAILRTVAGIDFHHYKTATVLRRLHRRASLLHCHNLDEYLERLRHDEEEVRQLSNDLLINVTSFFRDPEAWQELERQVVPDLFRRSENSERPIRAWVAGCASGEEAYSLAMVLCEQVRRIGSGRKVQIYASDIDGESRERARRGVYPANIIQDLEPELIDRYLVHEDGHYRVSKFLREMVIFADQNLLEDPPFSGMDLITCRNLLIYLKPEVQRRAIETFHFALNQDGYLFLGSAESLGSHEDLFTCLSKKWRLYQRRGDGRQAVTTQEPVYTRIPSALPAPQPSRPDDAGLLRDMLLTYHTPTALLIDHQGHLLSVHGDTTGVLRVPSGNPTTDALAMLVDELKVKGRNALRTARTQKRVARSHAPRRGQRDTLITVRPSDEQTEVGVPLHFLMTFEAELRKGADTANRSDRLATDESTDSDLERELESTREDLQDAVAELQESTERHKIQNEEIMSMNEELQSANEELETSKEELQSLNEELSTLNQQLEDKLQELEFTTDDLSNLLHSTNIATVFLDTHLAVRRFTPVAAELFNLRQGDVGRPFKHIASEMHDEDLLTDAEGVLKDLNSRQQQVTDGRSWFQRQIQPYRTQDNHIEGVVITLADITRLKQAEEQLEQAKRDAELQREHLSSLFDQAPACISVHEGPEHRFTLANPPMRMLVGGAEPLERTVKEVIEPHDGNLTEVFDAAFHQGEPIELHEHPWRFEHADRSIDGFVEILLRPWRDGSGTIRGVMTLAFDVTDEVLSRQRLQEVSAQLSQQLTENNAIISGMRDGLIISDADGANVQINTAARRLLGLNGEAIDNLDHLADVVTWWDERGEVVPVDERPLRRALGGEEFSEVELRVGSGDPDQRIIASCSGTPISDDDGDIQLAVITIRDVTERAEQERQLAEQARALARSNEGLQHFASLASHDLRTPLRLISTYLDLVLTQYRDRMPEDALPMLQRGMQASLQMRDLIDSLLRYARLEGQTLEASESVSLEEAVDAAQDLLEETISSSGATVRVGKMPRVQAQLTMLVQCVQNLIANAITHNDSDHPVVEISAQPIKSENRWRIVISDNGPGIPPQDRETVFEMFRRSRDSQRTPGSGIGLAFCRRIIEAFGGDIWIEENDGGGTAMCFTLQSVDRL